MGTTTWRPPPRPPRPAAPTRPSQVRPGQAGDGGGRPGLDVGAQRVARPDSAVRHGPGDQPGTGHCLRAVPARGRGMDQDPRGRPAEADPR